MLHELLKVTTTKILLHKIEHSMSVYTIQILLPKMEKELVHLTLGEGHLWVIL